MWTNDKSCAVCNEAVVFVNISIVLNIENRIYDFLNDKTLMHRH